MKKTAIIIGIVGTIAAIVTPFIVKCLPDREEIKIDGIMIEQRIIDGRGGDLGTVTVEKGITITRTTNTERIMLCPICGKRYPIPRGYCTCGGKLIANGEGD